jgi:hypothetical protein
VHRNWCTEPHINVPSHKFNPSWCTGHHTNVPSHKLVHWASHKRALTQVGALAVSLCQAHLLVDLQGLTVQTRVH